MLAGFCGVVACLMDAWVCVLWRKKERISRLEEEKGCLYLRILEICEFGVVCYCGRTFVRISAREEVVLDPVVLLLLMTFRNRW